MTMMRVLGIYPLEPHIRSEAKVVVLMNGVDGLAESIRRAVRNVQKGQKTNALRGRIVENDMVESGTNKRVFLVEVSGSNRRYFCKAAVDVDTSVGRLVWFLPTADKTSAISGVIVGA